jgi:uncharacterized protein
MRVVLDTNVIVSRYLSPRGTPARILGKWEEERFILLVSQPILDEYGAVLRYDHLRRLHHLSDDEVEEIIARFRNFSEFIEVAGDLRVIPEDPDDDRFLECAVAGGADYIISGNIKHLGKLGNYQGIQILQPLQFLTLLDSEDQEKARS